MKLAQLFPVQNCVINGYSLIDNVFGANFVVRDELGSALTTAKNVKLLSRAQTLVENLSLYDAQGFAYALAQLREEADLLRQDDYDRAVLRERHYRAAPADDLSVAFGSAR
jgi:hypothetical protein